MTDRINLTPVAIHEGVCLGSPDHQCPLLHPRLVAYEVDPETREKLEAAWAESGTEAEGASTRTRDAKR